MLQVGSVVAGYRVERLLGVGGMGEAEPFNHAFNVEVSILKLATYLVSLPSRTAQIRLRKHTNNGRGSDRVAPTIQELGDLTDPSS